MGVSRLGAGVVAMFLVAVLANAACGDEVRLKDGSLLIGEILDLSGGFLAIRTPFAERLTVPVDQIVSLDSEGEWMVELESGEQLLGRLRYRDGVQHVDSEAARAVPVPLPAVAAVYSPDQPSPATLQAQAAAERARARWSSSVTAGLSGQTGNTEQIAFLGRVDGLRETLDDRLWLFAQARYARDDGEESAREYIAGARMEVDVSERTFVFGKLELEHDLFEEIDLRTLATAGLGYFFIQRDDEVFKGRIGLGLLHESFTTDGSRREWIAEVGEDYRKAFSEWLEFTHSLVWYPTLDDIGDFRIVMENAAEIPITMARHWKLRLGVRNQYNARPATDAERLDTFYFANLVWQLR